MSRTQQLRAKGSRLVACVISVTALLTLVSVARDAEPAQAANGSCIEKGGGFRCEWNCNPQAATSWCWFDSGGENARNWFYNDATDFYASHVFKCAAAIKASNGDTWASQCGSAQTVASAYSKCSCGGLYVRTWNNASGARNLFSSAEQ